PAAKPAAQAEGPKPAPVPAAAQAPAGEAAPRMPVHAQLATPPRPAPTGAPDGGGNGGIEHNRHLSPAVRKIMREEGVSLAEVSAIPGSGVAGRVTRDDLIDYLGSRGTRPAASTTAPAVPAALPGLGALAPVATGPREEVVPFTKVRKLIAENMLRSKHSAAH